jgi:hypothetical protein
LHDLVLAKLVAGRERDWEFARDAAAAGLVDVALLLECSSSLPITAEHQEHLRRRVSTLAAGR